MHDHSASGVIEKLEKLYCQFNTRFFSGSLPMPTIIVVPEEAGRAQGWCTREKVWETEEDDPEFGLGALDAGIGVEVPQVYHRYYEISICAECLAGSLDDAAAALLHEMTHLYNLENGISDSSRNGYYHNKFFKKTAEEHGLIATRSDKYGFSLTELSDEAMDFLDSLYEDSFRLYRIPRKEPEPAELPQLKTYACPKCGCTVFSESAVSLRCIPCDAELVEI